MTSLETNHHAERLLAYLMTASEAPLDGDRRLDINNAWKAAHVMMSPL